MFIKSLSIVSKSLSNRYNRDNRQVFSKTLACLNDDSLFTYL